MLLANRKALWTMLVISPVLYVMAVWMAKCSEMPGTPALQQGQRVVFQMAGAPNLEQVGFAQTYPDQRPSDFVAMISDPAHPLWPKAKPDDVYASNSSNRVPMPPGVVFDVWERGESASDQIVIDADDEHRTIVVRGYVHGQDAPAFEYTWPFPTKAGRVPVK